MLEISRYLSQEPRSRFLQRFPCDVTPCPDYYKYAAELIDCERLRGITWSFVCSASWKAGELCVIESAVTVFFSDLLFICVVNLYKSYCSCYLCFVFS
ncbi:hypothetical protein AVEN_85924-1 [Araneus ventricosus]|uniref:Uncharacterized protein n=1 Tax=Araneus ventricosus TaxID=182803 RepID=A0A4Y2GGQ9_ARAVE|nr:hypothetical protein AVEN_85924-1 [Araneus ventricosus]